MLKENTNENEGRVGWDARQKFTTEIVYRLHLFLDASKDELKLKLETLSDLFYCVVGFIPDKERIRKTLGDIETLLYPEDGIGRQEIAEKKRKAAHVIDDTYILIFLAIKKADLLVPEKEYTDEVEEFEKLF